jgi:glycosyltransferase involved in cell wall biosynthesis
MPVLCLLFRKPTTAFFSIEKIFEQLSDSEEWRFQTQKVFLPFYSSSLFKIFRNLVFTRRQKADVYHVTGDTHYAVLGMPRKRALLTIHDCVFMRQSSGIRRLVFKWIFLDFPVRYCRLVTTISEATRQDIIRYTHCSPAKVLVIPNPLSNTIRYHAAPFRDRSPVILFIGVTPNKNLERVILALEGIDCLLKIIGKIPDPDLVLLEKYHIRYDSRANLTEEELAGQYTGSDLVLFPSLFEGFGLPIIEAQAAGRPVITSNLSPMKEVAGEGACLVDPHDVDAIRQGVLSVIRDKEFRERLVEKGLSNISRFTPGEVARQYQDCYRKLLAS